MTTQATTAQAITESITEPSSRLRRLPVYVFAWLDELKEAARAAGADLIDLGMGNPDLPTPQPIVNAIAQAIQDPANHRYPVFPGKPAFREAISRWMQHKYGVDINPKTEVQALIGSKEGLAHLAFAYCEAGTYTITPSPYYPVHSRGTWLAGGEVFHLPLNADNQFLPDLNSIPAEVAEKAKLFIVNYPNNPTAATASPSFYEELVAYCQRHQIILVSDMAYEEIAFDGYKPPSVLQIPGAKSVAIEYHSFTKSFNMAGWRTGFAVGNARVMKALHDIKTNLDYGVSGACQDGGIYALDHADELLPPIVKTYQDRRDVLVEGFRSLGWQLEPPKGTLYLWLPIPKAFTDSKTWVRHVMDTAEVVFTPGIAFGDAGDRYFRVSLVSPVETLKKAIERLKNKGIRYSE